MRLTGDERAWALDVIAQFERHCALCRELQGVACMFYTLCMWARWERESAYPAIVAAHVESQQQGAAVSLAERVLRGVERLYE